MLSTTFLEKILASDGASNDSFSHGVAISSDGNTLAVGAYQSGALDNGAVYVFTRSGNTWINQTKILASPNLEGGKFGYSVSISSDGNTLAVGNAPQFSGNIPTPPIPIGSVYVFTRSGVNTWTQQQQIQASDAASNNYFGVQIAISSDGNTLAVAAPHPNQFGAGGIYVYIRSGNTWITETKIPYTGGSVAISSNGTTLAVGSGVELGVYIRSGVNTWTSQANIPAPELNSQQDQNFGDQISISSDGNTLAISASGYDLPSTYTNEGIVYVYTRSGNTWNQHQRIQASDYDANDYFGSSVAITSDGNTLVVGAASESTYPNNTNGAVYVYTRDLNSNPTHWINETKILASDGTSGDYFGQSVAISSNGTLVVGAPNESTSNMNNGAAYTYNISLPDTTVPTVGSGPTFGTVLATSIVVNWTAASDDVTAQASLQYKLVRDLSSAAIDTVGEADAISGAGLVMDWTANTLTTTASGLTDSTTYFFAVLVRDASSNMSLYSPTSKTTAIVIITAANSTVSSGTTTWGSGSSLVINSSASVASGATLVLNIASLSQLTGTSPIIVSSGGSITIGGRTKTVRSGTKLIIRPRP